MSGNRSYKIVELRNGARTVHSLADAETFHPGIGPVAEAEALFVRQLHLLERVRATEETFVIWDVGLGAAANALTTVKSIAESLAAPKSIHLVSFDMTGDALEFALSHSEELGYFAGFEDYVTELLGKNVVELLSGQLSVKWEFVRGDFPGFLNTERAGRAGRGDAPGVAGKVPPPHAILFDPHSPQKNPAMWTVSLFAGLYRALDLQRPCALANFTRSTLARAAMLLGGFYVGVGRATGFKEETTVAANRLDLIAEPLSHRWLERALRSDSAEPLREQVYTRAPLSLATVEKLRAHPQFQL